MERMHEIMKERAEADEALSRFKKEQTKHLIRLNEEMASVGPIKIGDIVNANGYSHVGKKMIIDCIWIKNDWQGAGVAASGRVLKKDGTPGSLMAEYFIEVGFAP